MRALLLVVALAVGCKSSSPPPPPAIATTDQDALWALAPDRTVIGLVMSSRGVARLESAALDLQKWFAAAPELAPFHASLDDALRTYFGTASLSLAELGLTRDKGFALFITEGGE